MGNVRGWFDADGNTFLDDPIKDNGPRPIMYPNYTATDFLVMDDGTKIFAGATNNGRIYSAKMDANSIVETNIFADFARDVNPRGASAGVADIEILSDGTGYALLMKSGTIVVVIGSRANLKVSPPQRVTGPGVAVDFEILFASEGGALGHMLTSTGSVVGFGYVFGVKVPDMKPANPSDAKLNGFVDLETFTVNETFGAVAMTKFGDVVPMIYEAAPEAADLVPDEDFNLPADSAFFIVGFEIITKSAENGGKLGLMAVSTGGALHTFGPISRFLPEGSGHPEAFDVFPAVDINVNIFPNLGK